MASSPSPEIIRHTTRLMCNATEAILWGPAREWVRQRSARSELKCRIGSGQATYHRFDPNTHQHLITFGQRMVEAKFSAQSSQGWLSTREIQHKGYFDGDVSTANLLAHTCCHEFAHLLQSISGQRRYGSVHNAAFYTILDELHESGGAAAVRYFLMERSARSGIELPQATMNLNDVSEQLQAFSVGDAVRFGRDRHQREGEIVRINRRTCTVQGTGRWRGARYRVPVSLMSHR
ncbi:hypothetical protein RE428_02860 [Marinobacter nanhaiticus D15-8W]|nr:hypothetical protein [Marinobacter nanhaiticus]BES69268.1 hypothetical protein RE428_02860 [Marinobacter nanhaiticus D15-8W]